VVQRLPTGYVFDPEDPRAPSVEQWEQMLPDERARVVAMLPTEVPLDPLAVELGNKLAEEQSRREEEERRRGIAEQQLAEALAEIERLKNRPA
jgi:hypothetical protein